MSEEANMCAAWFQAEAFEKADDEFLKLIKPATHGHSNMENLKRERNVIEIEAVNPNRAIHHRSKLWGPFVVLRIFYDGR